MDAIRQRGNEANVEALDAIDLVFLKNKKVREAWKAYLDHLNVPFDVKDAEAGGRPLPRPQPPAPAWTPPLLAGGRSVPNRAVMDKAPEREIKAAAPGPDDTRALDTTPLPPHHPLGRGAR